MNPKDLFGIGLTVPRHENNDLHYIGEALPVPSLITSSISVEADADVGGSPVPAREDHVHAVDVDSLIQFINENEELVDLTNYYTKAEADAIHDAMIVGGDVDLSNYYTKGEIDSFLNILATSIDSIDARVTILEATTGTGNPVWTYSGVIAPTVDTSLGYRVAASDLHIVELVLTLVEAGASNYSIQFYNNGVPEIGGFVTITAGTLIKHQTVSIDVVDGHTYTVLIGNNVNGNGSNLVVEAVLG